MSMVKQSVEKVTAAFQSIGPIREDTPASVDAVLAWLERD